MFTTNNGLCECERCGTGELVLRAGVDQLYFHRYRGEVNPHLLSEIVSPIYTSEEDVPPGDYLILHSNKQRLEAVVYEGELITRGELRAETFEKILDTFGTPNDCATKFLNKGYFTQHAQEMIDSYNQRE